MTDVKGAPAGIVLYHKKEQMVLLALEETNKYACKQGMRGAVQPLS